MPCYQFTWHTYGSWLPDRSQGYVHWSRGWEPTNIAMANRYRQQKDTTARLSEVLQRNVIEELTDTFTRVRYRLHFVATEWSHIHVLASWPDERGWPQLRRSIRRSISLELNRHERRKWLSRGGPPQRVKSQDHFDYLVEKYLPSHRGWKWCERRGLFK